MRAPKNDNRKRKVIFDFSDDEYEDVISLASPSSPKVNSRPDVELSSEDSGPEKPDADVSPEIKSEEPESSKEDRQNTASVDASTTLSTEKIQAIGSEAEVNPSKRRTTAVPSSPKRKKVLKSRIDDRGREGMLSIHIVLNSNKNKQTYVNVSYLNNSLLAGYSN